MTRADDLTIDYLGDVDLASPAEIAEETDYNRKYIGRRARKLARAGLLENLGRGLYQITDRGREYLEGEFDARTLDEPEGDG
jgi:predicted transcriptional regulator